MNKRIIVGDTLNEWSNILVVELNYKLLKYFVSIQNDKWRAKC